MNILLTVLLLAALLGLGVLFRINLQLNAALETSLGRNTWLADRAGHMQRKLVAVIEFATGYRTADPNLSFEAIRTFMQEARNSTEKMATEKGQRDVLRNPAFRLSDDERKVLAQMDDVGLIFDVIGLFAGIETPRVRDIIRAFRGEGLVEMVTLRDNGRARGKGYRLTEAGMKAKRALGYLPAVA